MKKDNLKMDYEIKIWDENYEPPKTTAKKVNKEPKNKNNSSLNNNSKKRKRFGFRHALYALLWGFIIQSVVLVPYLVNLASTAALSGEDVTVETLTSFAMGPAILFFAQISMYVGWWLVSGYASYFKGAKSFVKDFWFKFKWVRDISLGLAIAVGLRLLEQLLFWILGLFNVDLSGADNTSAFTSSTGFWSYMLLFGVVAFIGPISEELLFRGLMLQGLLKTFGKKTLVPRTWFGEGVQRTAPNVFSGFVKFKEFLYKHKNMLAVLISSVFFGFMHFQGTENFGQWLVVIETGLIGVLLAVIVLKTKRLGLAITTHVFFNLSAVLITLFLT